MLATKKEFKVSNLKPIIFIAVLLMTTRMIPLSEAEPIITVTPSENHYIPEVRPGNSTGSQPYMAGWMQVAIILV